MKRLPRARENAAAPAPAAAEGRSPLSDALERELLGARLANLRTTRAFLEGVMPETCASLDRVIRRMEARLAELAATASSAPSTPAPPSGGTRRTAPKASRLSAGTAASRGSRARARDPRRS